MKITVIYPSALKDGYSISIGAVFTLPWNVRSSFNGVPVYFSRYSRLTFLMVHFTAAIAQQGFLT